MGISELRQLGAGAGFGSGSVEGDLIRRGVLSARDASMARFVGRHCDASMDRILMAEGLVDERTLLDAHARRFHSRDLTAESLAALSPLEVDIAPEILLKHVVLPVHDRDGAPAIVLGEPANADRVRALMPEHLRLVRILLAPRAVVQERISDLHWKYLAAQASARVNERESCRGWGRNPGRRMALVLGGMGVLGGVTVIFPSLVFGFLASWAVLTLMLSALFKSAAFVTHMVYGERRDAFDEMPLSEKAPLPKVSVLVPLFRETEIAHALVARLARLTYPKCLLDVVLVLEEEDDLTKATLAQVDLPPWCRVVVVPDGGPRTKPRAMNYALDFCEGDIIGIFDAEDAPDPDQITRVARQFQKSPPEVACLQGILDYYNPRQNWLARCFTIEYATWFRMILPGMARMGFAIPLGGTTLYFRREALEQLGGWDAHNVTEDADLGFRLARYGYRTEMVQTVTEEEANCRPWPWIKQRSRWLKGYMTTYLVHMRHPGILYRQLGGWKFLGFQLHFLTALSQVLLAPVLWSFWLVLLGLPHPLGAVWSPDMLVAVGASFLVIEVVNLTIYFVTVSERQHAHLLPWVPTMHVYGLFGVIAAYKAVYELVRKPFFWDKTTHGLSLDVVPPPVLSQTLKRPGDLS